ncbi:hypothetical protein NBO_14g0001 [Nosema bombycis CQ1]|uniref:Uncharacterized protein n=1 Tax=Nosema bombycis (strain CQ1 / CVCC 102059) TaxID=578461 RepID=R0MA24_NOSB1|nr:hypothetical protein NBO_14g0001 [Nosema bombycis CQ1]|eukprot:EOB14814.1 hypothetical protein NBO_14g0001 [Nosema bombycis CQ1]
MKSHNLNLLITIILLFEGFFCTEFKDMSVRKKSNKHTGHSQIELHKDVSHVCKAGVIKETVEGKYSSSSTSSVEDDPSSSTVVCEDESSSSTSSDGDDSNSSSHSAESIFSSFKNFIKNDVCSFEIQIKNDDDDLELIKEYIFEQSTIIYVMEILSNCKKESEAVDVSYDYEKLLRFFDNFINLIDLFIIVFSWKKNDSMIILKDKVKKITENFDSLDNALLEIDKIINGAIIRNEKSNFKKILKGSNKLKKRFGNVKKELEKHKERWNYVPDFNLALNIETFNNYKKMLIDEKDLIITQGQNNIKNQIENLKSNLLKDIIKDLERFYDCLKNEYDVLTFDFSILNDLLHW